MPTIRSRICRLAAILLTAGMLAGCVKTRDISMPGSPASTEPSTARPLPAGKPIVYYHFVSSNPPFPQGSVVILPDTYILAPIEAEIPNTSDTAADLQHALNAAITDPQNLWVSSKLEIAEVSFEAARADVLLRGERYGVGDVTLIAARMQILMTIFANPAVDSATVTLDGDTIGNWGVSSSMNARPADYLFSRAEIESFMAENAYKVP